MKGEDVNFSLLQIFTVARTHFSILRSLFLHPSRRELNRSVCGLNWGSFIIALAQTALKLH